MKKLSWSFKPYSEPHTKRAQNPYICRLSYTETSFTADFLTMVPPMPGTHFFGEFAIQVSSLPFRQKMVPSPLKAC